MRALLQRVTSANVQVEGKIIGEIASGWVVFLGVGAEDEQQDVDWLVQKILDLRLFKDEQGKFNLSVLDVKGALLIVSQFTLYADCSRGRRPSFTGAASPAKGNALYLSFIEAVKNRDVSFATGKFGADMQVSLTNDGPVTIWLDSRSGKVTEQL